jgi:serine/threonine-protein kinase
MKKADHENLVGRTIAGKFVVENLLGTGAMGAVFRARQIALDKTVAIKVMHGEHAKDPAFAGRFQREAKAASRLNHPNSIQVLDFGAEPDGLLYIAMEYLDGRSLHHVIREDWPLAPARIADVLMQTLAALAVAHDQGVVHRDLKPENVMVLKGTDDDGKPKDVVKVCDFGIAKISDPRAYRGAGERESEAPVTTAGFLVGTPEYMSPEQGRGEKLDPRSDLYSVGVILYEMLTKRVPFDAENAIGVVMKHITEDPKLPSEMVAGVDPRLEAITLRALKKFREERYPNARDMRAELRAVIDTPVPSLAGPAPVTGAGTGDTALGHAATVAMPITPVPPSVEPPGPKPTLQGTTAAAVEGPAVRRRSLLLAGIVVLALGAGSLGTAFVVRGRSHPSPMPASPVIVPPVASMVPIAPSVPAKIATPPMEVEDEPAHGSTASHAVTPVAPMASAHTKNAPPGASTGAKPAASSPPSTSAVPAASAPTEPSAAPAESAAPGASAPPPSDSAAPADSAPLDPEKAYVEIGMINAQGVRERAVRIALHGVPLAHCYRTSLRTKGSRATGVATLTLAFDENGQARSAILSDADFLPGLAHCVQESATSLKLPKPHVDPGGGTAEVTLGFREP